MSRNEEPVKKTKIAGPFERNPRWGPAGMSCPGCESGKVATILRELFDELELTGTAISVSGVRCAAGGLTAYLKVDEVGGAWGRAPDYALGIKRVHPDAFVFTFQGDGDAFGIGMGPTMNAASRGEKITLLMCNNACIGNTGGQMTISTPLGATSTTTPKGREPGLDGYPILAAELLAVLPGVAYSARGAVNTPAHRQQCKRYLKTAFEKQINNVGFSYVEILIACPTNRRLSPVEAVKWVEEVQIPQFPLGEFKNVDMIA